MIDFLLLKLNKLVINQHYLINMENKFNNYIIVSIVFLIVILIGGCCIQSHYNDNKLYETTNVDSIKQVTIDSVNKVYVDKFKNYTDSVDKAINESPVKEIVIHDTIYISKDNEDLIVAKYKLERIRYYNSIAAKGNNIKYLRGWINRVLNEK